MFVVARAVRLSASPSSTSISTGIRAGTASSDLPGATAPRYVVTTVYACLSISTVSTIDAVPFSTGAYTASTRTAPYPVSTLIVDITTVTDMVVTTITTSMPPSSITPPALV